MYIPKQFEVTNKEEVFSFIEANAFGQLISNVKHKLFSSHIPFLLSDDKTKIIGHLSRQNPQYEELVGQETLITLEGPHDYISPSWYSSPGVPTWNYQAVHIYGHCQVFHCVDQLKEVVDALTHKYESSFQKPWQPNYKASMLKAIVGVEITISEIQCKYKLSQNRSNEDQEEAIKQLDLLGSTKLAKAMKQK